MARWPYGVTWVVFIATVLVGAALILSPRDGLQALGFALLWLPLLLFGSLMAIFYWKSRRAA